MTDETYGLVMPFVVCGDDGPYDSASFVAGCRFTQDQMQLDAETVTGDGWTWQRYVYPAMLPQYDLLAMHHGLVMESEPWDEHPDEWTLITFRRPELAEDTTEVSR